MDSIISSNMDPNHIGQAESSEIQNKAKQEQEEQMRNDLLAALLEPAARGRLSRIALVSPERSKKIEDNLLRAGIFRRRLTEQDLINLLDEEGVKEKAASAKSEIKYHRKGNDDFKI